MNNTKEKNMQQISLGGGGVAVFDIHAESHITLGFLRDLVSSAITTAHQLIPRKASDSCVICCIVTLPRTATSYRKIRRKLVTGEPSWHALVPPDIPRPLARSEKKNSSKFYAKQLDDSGHCLFYEWSYVHTSSEMCWRTLWYINTDGEKCSLDVRSRIFFFYPEHDSEISSQRCL
jgi:hypothetical protein